MRTRAAANLVAIALAIVAGGYARDRWLPPARHELAEAEAFWVLKTHQPPRYDVVMAGDSRTYRGASPSAMRVALPTLRVLNFGYSSGGLASPLLEAAAAKLDPAGARVIVLGVSPFSLTPMAAENGHFKSFLHQDPRLYEPSPWAAGMQRYFDPIIDSPALALQREINAPPEGLYYHEDFFDDGWVGSWTRPEDPTRAIKDYQETFAKTRVSPAVAGELFEQVRHWTDAGIQVFAFRPPTTQAMVALENEVSGYDEVEVAARLTQAGAVWLDFSSASYRTYDGSHLHQAAAAAFSLDLARAMEARLHR